MKFWQTIFAVLIAFCSAALITYGMNSYLRSKEEKGKKITYVLIAKEDIYIGQKISPEKVEWQSWSTNENLPDGYIIKGKNKLSEVFQKTVTDAFVKGEPINKNALLSSERIFATRIQKNKRAFSFVNNKKYPILPYLRAGDLIDIIVVQDKEGDSKTLLSGIKVLDVNEYFEDSLKGGAEGHKESNNNKKQEITIEAAPGQIELLLPYARKKSLAVSLHSAFNIPHPQKKEKKEAITILRGAKKEVINVKS